ncbi:nuclear pore complex protein Nup133 [Biomphalaria glabrata]|nr:nuclear pore complex protein Nup133-like [Biomphalaria glabrata]
MFSPRTPMAAAPSPFYSPSSSRLSRRNPKPKNQSTLSIQSFHGTQILDETSLHKIEPYGLPLPVLITEALTLSDRSTTEITARIDPSGWAWLVGARKLFVWRYRPFNNSKNVQCKELTLPPSDLAHSADRVCIIPNENQPAACVAVSPEGVVRYWPNIAFESNIAEISAELRGEECARVINFQPHGCLLATTTSSLWLLVPAAGQASLQCKPLKASQGLFSGISRRMSSFIFGSSQIQTNGIPLQAILAAPYVDDEDDNAEEIRAFYVLSGNSLCKWQIPGIGCEKLLYQLDAERMFRDALAKKLWGQDAIHLTQLKTWLIDLQLTRDGIVMLAAGVNMEADQKVYYALAFLDTSDEARSLNINNLVVLDYTQKYSEEMEDQISSYKLLFVSTEKANTAFIFNSSTILMLSSNLALDKMDLKTTGDVLLGAGCVNSVAVFFSNAYGFFSVSPPKIESSILDESTSNLSLASRTEFTTFMMAGSKVNELIESNDNKLKLKGAFIASLSNDQDQIEATVSEILETTHPKSGIQTSELDTIVAGVSQDLIDDYPNADPRWAESDKQDSTGSTASVILIQQLKDKQKAHDLFVAFLKRFGLWNQMNLVGVRNSVMPTRLLLCEHVEKLEAAIALREAHSKYCKILDLCIQKAVQLRQVAIPSTLTAQDLFYREVSSIHEIAQQLIKYESEFVSSDHPSQNVVNTILAVNALLEGMLYCALKYRQDHCDMYAGNTTDLPEFIPWTATPAMRKIIKDQIGLILEKGLPEAREVDVQGTMYQNIVGLADIFLDGYASQLKSLELQENKTEEYSQLEREFDRERQKLILPLLEHKQFDRAASLAEKFADFEILVRICDMTDNQDRLQRYRSQFAEKGFSQFLYNWYLKEGKRGHLLSKSLADGDELSAFLNSDNVQYLSWLHEIRRGNFEAAHSSLAALAKVEKNFLAKKKTLLSLSKLAALASEDEDNLQENIEAIDEELALVLHQEVVPPEVFHNLGMDPDNMRVMSPEELIQLYVSEHNSNASELDVKKALDLLHHVDQNDESYEQLKSHIWCRAILMDSWDETDVTDPIEVNKDKIFFRTLDLVYLDGELDLFKPDLETLLSSSELAHLKRQPNFVFLMRAGYEHIENALQ